MTETAPVAAPPSPLPSFPSLRSFLACPEDGGALAGWDERAPEGALCCTTCARCFPVADGLPRLLPDGLRSEYGDCGNPGGEEFEEFHEKRREMAARDVQAGDYDRMLGLRLFSIPEIPLTLRFLAPEPDHWMLEAGCGTGRMTPFFARRVRGLICADLSVAALRAARAKLSPDLAARTLFVQADLSHLPLRADVFDRVGSFQVLEHVPTNDARARAGGELARVLKPRREGGRLSLSAYRWGAPLCWLSAKQGHHDGGIPFFRFTRPELFDLLAPHIHVHACTGALAYHHLLWGRRHA